MYLWGMKKDVSWSELDRWNYSTFEPTPSNYTLYTGLSLQETLLAFFTYYYAHIKLLDYDRSTDTIL